MKRTAEDDSFIQVFSSELRRARFSKEHSAKTDGEFGLLIGVSGPGLRKYLGSGSMPSHRTVVLAYRNLGICIAYDRVSTLTLLRRSRRARAASENQLDLPFEVSSRATERLTLTVVRRSANRYGLALRIRRTG